jgi:hypothetical protein
MEPADRFGVEPPQVLRVVGKDGRRESQLLLGGSPPALKLEALDLNGGNGVEGRSTVRMAFCTRSTRSSGICAGKWKCHLQLDYISDRYASILTLANTSSLTILANSHRSMMSHLTLSQASILIDTRCFSASDNPSSTSRPRASRWNSRSSALSRLTSWTEEQ